MWTAGGREVLYIASRDDLRRLWRMPRDGSRPASPVASLGPIGTQWAISARGDRLAYSDHGSDRDIWRVDLPGGNRLSRVASSSAPDLFPDIAPNGNRISFVSRRVGGPRVWVSGLDGANPIDLARTAGRWPGPARWSPDGNQIAFECDYDGNDDICVVPAGGGGVRRLTRHPARDSVPSWSHDGKWIYFTSHRSGSFQVWKVPADRTDSAATQLTTGGGFCPLESPDGTAVFFTREPLSDHIWKVSVRGGEEAQTGGFRILGPCYNFAVSTQGIYYASSPDSERWFELWLYRFSTGKSEPISRIQKGLAEGLSVSPDGRWLLFAAVEGQFGDLYMVEDFR